MTNHKYIEIMNKLTNSYNRLNNENNSYQKKHEILFFLLYTMYEKQFNKQINVGVLAQIIVGQSTKSLIDQAFFSGNEKIIFDPQKNTLKLGDIFHVSITRECPRFMQEEMVVGNAINLKVTNPLGEEDQFFLCSNENELWIEQYSFQFKSSYKNSLYTKPNALKTYEKRTFDSYGIETEREINTNFTIGIQTIPELTNQNDYDLVDLEIIKNKIKITRDPFYFMIAKIEMSQKNILHGEYTFTHFRDNSTKTMVGTAFQKETYGLCPYGQSLDVNLYYDIFEEAIEVCKSLNYLNVNGNIDDKRTFKTIPKLNFIPNMNKEIKVRIQNARNYIKNSETKKCKK